MHGRSPLGVWETVLRALMSLWDRVWIIRAAHSAPSGPEVGGVRSNKAADLLGGGRCRVYKICSKTPYATFKEGGKREEAVEPGRKEEEGRAQAKSGTGSCGGAPIFNRDFVDTVRHARIAPSTLVPTGTLFQLYERESEQSGQPDSVRLLSSYLLWLNVPI